MIEEGELYSIVWQKCIIFFTSSLGLNGDCNYVKSYVTKIEERPCLLFGLYINLKVEVKLNV
jgi:hypothetical protein